MIIGHDGDSEESDYDDSYEDTNDDSHETTDDKNHEVTEDDNDSFQIFGGGGFETDNGSSAECIEECEKRTGCKQEKQTNNH